MGQFYVDVNISAKELGFVRSAQPSWRENAYPRNASTPRKFNSATK
jgi:hypothetical protein